MSSPELDTKPLLGLASSAYAAGTFNGPAIETNSFAKIAYHAVVATVTAATADAVIQESDDGSSGWTTVAGTTLSLGVADANTMDRWGMARTNPRKGFLRIQLVVTGTLFAVGFLAQLRDPANKLDQDNPPSPVKL